MNKRKMQMRVIVLGTRGFPNVQGGVEKHSEELAVNLVKLGCEVIVFTRRPYVNPELSNYKGVKLRALPAIKSKSLETMHHTLLGVFKAARCKPDILHMQAIGSGLFVPLAKLMGMKIIVTSHGSNYMHQKWGRFAKFVLKISEFLSVTFADGVIAISQTIADEIEGKYNRKAAVIPNGVNKAELITSDGVIGKYKLEKGKYILSVGRFVEGKGIDDLIEAFELFQKNNNKQNDSNSNLRQFKDWKLVIVGQADHNSRYSLDITKRAEKNNKIVLAGFLSGETLQEIYTHAGLFVLPSYYEGLPIVLLEAMSYGLSCIASDIPGNRCLSLAEERYFLPGDIEQIIQKLKKFMTVPMNDEDKENQIRQIKENYDWGNIAKKTLQVYEKVLSAKK